MTKCLEIEPIFTESLSAFGWLHFYRQTVVMANWKKGEEMV